MYSKDGKLITLEQAQKSAAHYGLSIEDWANKYGWTLEGKQNGSTEMTPTEEPLPTPAGDSSLGDISLELQEIPAFDPSSMPEMVQDTESYMGVQKDFDVSDVAYKEKPVSAKLDRFAQNAKEYAERTGGEGIMPFATIEDAEKTDVSGDPYMNQIAVQSKSGDMYYLAAEAPRAGEKTSDDIFGVKEWGGTPTTTAEDVEFTLQDEQLELGATESNLKYNTARKTTFVDTYFGEEIADLGINKEDFEGWLNKHGYSSDFEQDLKDGVYTRKWYDGFNTGGEYTVQEELDIAREKTLAKMLNDYIDYTETRAEKRAAIEDYKNNPEKYSDSVGFDDIYNSWQVDNSAILYDSQKIGQYAQVKFAKLIEKDKKAQALAAKEYRQRKAQGVLGSADETIGDHFETFFSGFAEGGMDAIRWAETGLVKTLGLSDAFIKRSRVLDSQFEDWKVSSRLTMPMSIADGARVTVGDTNYFVDKDGNVFDIDEEVPVNGILSNNQLSAIISAASDKPKTETYISTKGTTMQLANVMGNIAFQLLGTKGAGSARVAASTRYMATANGFKNVRQYKKYLSLVEGGGTNMRGINNVATFGKKLPFNTGIVDATMFQTFYGAATGYEQTIKAAKDAGLTNAEAESLAAQAMLEMGVLYGLTGPINPRIKAMKNLDDFLASRGVVNKAVRDFLNTGKNPQIFRQSLVGGLTKAATKAKDFISEGSKEVVQENIQQLGEFKVVNKRLNEKAGVDFTKDTYSMKDFMETSVLSFVSAGLLGSVNLSNIGFKQSNEQKFINLYLFANNIKGSTNRLNTMVEAGRITQEQADEIIAQANAVKNQASKMPKFLLKSNVDAVEVAQLMQEIENAEALKKRIHKSLHGPIDQSIKETDDKISLLLTKAEAQTVENIAGKAKTEIYNSKAEMRAAGYSDADLDADGFFKADGTIVINLEVASKNRAISVASHELLHRILKAEMANNKNMPKIINELRNILKQKAPSALSAIDKRIVDNKYNVVFKEDGTIEGADIDEYMTMLSDAIAQGDVPFEALQESEWRRIGRLIFNAIRTAFGNIDKEFTSGQQVFDFIKDYRKSIEKGKLSFEAKAKFKAKVKKTPLSQEEAEDRKKSLSAAAGRAKDSLDKMQEEGYDPNSLELYESLQGMVGAQLSKYQAKGLQITDEEEAISDVVSRLYTQRDVNKFDGRGTLYGYLNGRIKFRILDALKANPVWVENFEDIDVDGLEGKATRQIAEEDAEITISEPVATTPSPSTSIRPEYKSLLRRRVVEPEVVKSIEDKVLRTVRLLKSRIDAKVSKNVTVTPIIKEIKKEMGKQADIDLKTAMGGKKDGELRKFLLRNKAAILENMSTTWLSTAMPIAIQKSVDGVWTSDWKGKKIDREKTTTDLAGRTSGADLVRRLPKAATAISDADFLATILQPDGNPIRGKKESLAKAIAEEISFDIIKQALQDPNHPITQALIENQQRLGVENAENLGPEFVRQSERGNVKYSITKQQRDDYKKSTVAEILSNISERRAFYNKTINETLEAELGKGNGIYNLKNDEDLYTFINIFKEKIAPHFPKEFFFRKDSVYTSLIGNADSHGMRNNTEQFINVRNIIKAELGLDEKGNQIPGTKPIKWGPPIKNLEGYRIKGKNGKLLTAENILETEEGLQEYMKAGDVLRYNRMVETIHREMWLRFNDIIQNEMADPNSNGEAARFIGTYIASSHSDSNHPQRLGAGIAGYIKGYGTAKNIKKEHATPNSYTGRLLLETAFKKPSPIGERYNFEKDYRFITRNYVLIAFSNEFDAILNKSSLKENMPRDYDPINGNFGERYFNKITKLDPDSLILMSGNSYASVAGVDENGKYISDKLIDFIKKASDERLNRIIENFESKNEIVKSRIASQLAQTALIEDRFKEGQRKYSKSFPPAQVLNNEFNKMLERQSGISANEQISRIRGQIAGKGKGRFKFFIAPGADDFRGLVHYAFAGKGKQGDKDMAFFEENLMRPYFQGIAAIDSMRQQIKREFRVVTKEYQEEYKKLSEQIPGTPFTYDHALRVYMWSSQGTDIPGISAKDKSMLEDIILDNPALADLGEALMIVGRRETWPKPSEFWTGDSVLADLNSMTEKVGRKEILAQFIENADAIFTEENLNKIEAIKGRAHREAIENALTAMKTGTNRPMAKDRQMTKWLNWINGSTGAIMFFNRRSALLQMLSFTNFINWSDNNPVKAAAAFADQKQYWKDWVMIFNSDKLKERRGGLKQDVSDSEIAQVAGRSKNSPQAILAYLLKIGFTPTQIADSVAIATGGATFYRNRVNTYVKQGKSIKEAEKLAFEDFSKTSDEAQQSSDPALVSKEQRSVLGRLILAFANTPMQYTRLMKKAGLDLINGRGDWKTNVSKIAYYGLVQNFIFSALQSALFALAFDDEEEDDEKAKKTRDSKIYKTVNSMIDTVLRGSGIYGAAASTIKNTIQTYYAQEEKGYMADHAYTILAAFNISPPIGSKLRKLYNAIQTRRFEKDNMEVRGWAITADGKLNLGPNWSILGSLVSGGLNVPLDRVVDELSSISEALDARNAAWQRIALALGWKTWDVGARNEEADLIETQAKEARKQKGIEKAKETRRKNKQSKPVKKRGWTK